jgi:hypothetical protein
MDATIESYRRKRMLVIFTTDFLVLAEIVFAMYRAAHDQADLTSVFVANFFSLFLPTMAVLIVVLKILRTKYRVAILAEEQKAEPVADEGGLVV